MVRVGVKVRVTLFQRNLVCSRGVLKFLFTCKGFYGVLQRSRRFQYLPLWLRLGLGCSREIYCVLEGFCSFCSLVQVSRMLYNVLGGSNKNPYVYG